MIATSALPTLALLAFFAAIPPLNDSQQTRLETADDGARTVDEAAFYALLENAEQWPQDVAAGAIVPDFQAIRDDPAAHRGQLFLIEGRTIALLPEHDWSRSGWGSVRGLAIRIDSDDDPPVADDIIIVHLIDPPDEVSPGQPIRLVARFHKVVRYERLRNEGRAPYLNFVGRGVLSLGRPQSSGNGVVLTVLLLVFAFLGIVFLIWRVRAFKRDAQKPTRTAVYMAEKRQRRAVEQPPEDIDQAIEESNLPDDPADALDAMNRRRENPDESS